MWAIRIAYKAATPSVFDAADACRGFQPSKMLSWPLVTNAWRLERASASVSHMLGVMIVSSSARPSRGALIAFPSWSTQTPLARETRKCFAFGA